MDIFSLFSLLGGLAMFLFGMSTMGNSLEKLSGGKLECRLEKMTSSTFKGFLLGIGVTAVIQSSSATTVMVVGFVNSGILKLRHAIGIIMGANVGTTVTSWILSLTGIEGDSFWLKCLKPENFSPLFAFVGVLFIMFAKKPQRKDLGVIFIGFSILMFGMETMSGAVEPLADMPWFQQFMTMFNNPVMGVIVGALLTAVLQSSSASVGVLQVLSKSGSITYGMAIPIIMGQNIGTCVTALLSCIGAKKNAKRAAFVHLYFNIIGTLVWLAVFYITNAIVHFNFIDAQVSPAYVAVIHTAFNILSTLLLLPFAGLLEKLACLTIKDKETDDDAPFLDERFLQTPAVATEQCVTMSCKMAELTKKSLIKSMNLLEKYDEKKANDVIEAEKIVDRYEDVLGSYLVRLGREDLSVRDSKTVSRLLRSIGDFERISDHAVSVCYAAKEMYDKNISFSQQAQEEILKLSQALDEVVQCTVEAFKDCNLALARRIEPMEQVIDELSIEIRSSHIQRLRDGICTIELGFILSDIITSFERVSDHCSNIAVCLIEISNDSFDTHQYVHTIKKEAGTDYDSTYSHFKEKYSIE
ncbi:MAG: Na/Pi cotransporter family protein [Acutalibacteraceae bacterium]